MSVEFEGPGLIKQFIRDPGVSIRIQDMGSRKDWVFSGQGSGGLGACLRDSRAYSAPETMNVLGRLLERVLGGGGGWLS